MNFRAWIVAALAEWALGNINSVIVKPCEGAYSEPSDFSDPTEKVASECIQADQSKSKHCGHAYASANPRARICEVVSPHMAEDAFEQYSNATLEGMLNASHVEHPLSDKCQEAMLLFSCATWYSTCDASDKIVVLNQGVYAGVMSTPCRCLCDNLCKSCGGDWCTTSPGSRFADAYDNTNCTGSDFCGHGSTLVV